MNQETARHLVILEISKAAAYRPGRKYLNSLRSAFVSARQLTTLLMLCHDLNYVNTDKYLDLNSKINMFSSKLWKFMKYTERKLRRINNK
jgi:hypothetical protein